MILSVLKNTVLLFLLIMISCGYNDRKKSAKDNEIMNQVQDDKNIVVGANQIQKYLPLLNGKKVGIVANQTSVIFKKHNNYTHLVDSLIALNIDVKKVFSPEHGFRGNADAGEVVKDGIDSKTSLPIISLYGKKKKPSKKQLEGLDVIIFDIQDIGVRFYTYIYTLHYVMEACSELDIPVIVLDRPNPNGHYVDGPILETGFKSFIGMHPTPIVYGMTNGEYAKMIIGEQWLENNVSCDLTVIPLVNYTHDSIYSLPIRPSPNLPNDKSINLYPSVCLFEGTNVSEGRGTELQFQIFGSPFLDKNKYTYQFTPQPNFGSKYPKHKNTLCYGTNLSHIKNLSALNLNWLINAYQNSSNKEEFFIPFFAKLAGTKKLQQQIEAGLSEAEIKATWQEGLDAFKKTRSKYLIYD
jgi:uncharacterized protein YbbC (DUF1343 family)